MSIQRCIETQWQPQSYLVYKPRGAGNGVAMGLQLRLDPTWNEEGHPERKNTHGLFLELAPQEGKGEEGFAKFGWASPKLMRVKLGIIDVTKILAALREVRLLGREVPLAYRPSPDKNYTVTSFHKFNNTSTAINMTFEAERSFLRISRSATNAQSITLDLHEELGFQMYLEESLKQFFRFGIR